VLVKEKVNPKVMKRQNKKLIMKYLIETGPHSRPEITRHTMLASSAVWRITNELVEEGLIEKKGSLSISGKRKSTIYGPSQSFVASLIFNVEILETIVAVGYLDRSWKIIEAFPTPRNFEDFAQKVFEIVKREGRRHTFRPDKTRIVFSLPGMVDSEKGVLRFAPNLKWINVDFRRNFEKAGLEVIVENDSDLSLLAESFFAEDIKTSNTAFFLYLSEGIGGSIMIDRKIVKGKNFAAGEIGHTILYVDNLTKVERLLSILKLVERVEERRKIEGKTLEEKFENVLKLWISNDEWVQSVMEDFLNHIAVTLKNILYLLNPGIVVLGGVVNDIWERFGSIIQRKLEQLTDPFILEGVKIRDTIFKEVPPSLPGCNVLAIEKILEEI